MRGIDPHDEAAVLAGIKALVVAEQYHLSDHVLDRMGPRGVTPPEIFEAMLGAQLLENYPSYVHGPCCLIYGDTAAGRPLHIVCSTTLPQVAIITVYEPMPPKWRTPTERGE